MQVEKHELYKVNKIKGGLFNYVLSTGPIDFFEYSLSREQIISNIANSQHEQDLEIDHIKNIEIFVEAYVEKIEETPHTIRYLGVLNPGMNDIELVVIAKISNNGTCFIFSDNLEYLEFIKNRD